MSEHINSEESKPLPTMTFVSKNRSFSMSKGKNGPAHKSVQNEAAYPGRRRNSHHDVSMKQKGCKLEKSEHLLHNDCSPKDAVPSGRRYKGHKDSMKQGHLLHNDCSPKDAVPSGRRYKGHQDSMMQELNYLDIYLQFGKCFVDDSVKDIIETKFNALQVTNVYFSYQETSFFPAKGETNCRFTIMSKEMPSAIDILKKLVIELKKEMQVKITYNYDKTYNSSSETQTSVNSKELSKSHEKDNQNLKISACTTSDQTPFKCNSHEKQMSIKRDISRALHDIDTKIKKILDSHKQKSDAIQKKIDNYEDFEFMSEKEKEDKYVLQQKLKELKLQKCEFVQCCDTLKESLNSLDPLKATSEDILISEKAVGIECSRIKNALPIYARRKDIVNHVRSNQVSVILGETGSGKSTQLAQYLYEAGFAKHGSIICTQPRRIAAITLAERVSNEMVKSVGDLVGYKVGTGKKSSKETRVFFTTDHSLLNECLNDPDLKNYSCIIVDEAHERSIYTDILLGIIKICIQKRPELKVIITSATIDPEVFIKYFDSGPELQVSGRTFPVDLYYADDERGDFEKYEDKAVSKAFEIHSTEGPGDILVFLTSPVEIMRCCEEFEKRCRGRTDFKCLPLHGQLPSEEQKEVFEKLSEKQRKIVFATNCAETSITIDGIKYVIDTGVAKEMKYDARRNMNQLGIHAISKSSANQRKGRAGRTASGKCYRLYSKDGFDAMESLNDPEILRVHLGQAVLKLSELGIDIRCYDFVQAPSEIALSSAIETLEYLGAIVRGQITNIGKWLSKLPFDPKLSFAVYEGEKNNVLFDAIVLASVISSGSDLFFRGFTESEAQVAAKSKIVFGSKYGDTFTWLNVYKAWSNVKDNEKLDWCRSHCINNKCINYVRQTIKDVKSILSRDLAIDLRENFSTENDAVEKLRKILFTSMADNISNFSGVFRAGYFTLISERQVHVHPSSILVALNLEPEWLVYTNLIRTSREFIKGITVVEEEWVNELVEAGKLDVDITKAKQNKFLSVHREEVGPSIFNALVGPRFSNLRVLEEDLLKSGLSRSILEAIRDLGTFEIYSPFSMNISALDKFNEIKSRTIEKLLLADFEFSLNKKESIVSSGTRVVIGSGGCVKSIFMPNESDKVLIKRTHPSVTEEIILKKFETFGEIKEIVQFKSHDPWGFVRYGSIAEALSAVIATRQDHFNSGVLKIDKHAKNVKNMFDAKVTWIRRPIKGTGTAFVKCSPLDQAQLVGHNIWLFGKSGEIKISKQGDLIIFKTGSLTENEIKEQMENLMRSLGLNTAHLNVTVSREVVHVSEDDLIGKIGTITYFLKRYFKEDTFKVNMLTPKQGSVNYVCFLSFIDPVRGYRVCEKMRRSFLIDGRPVDVSPCLKTIVHVPEKLKVVCEERFKSLFSGLAHYKNTELSWKELKKDFAIEIKSSKPADIVEARDMLCKEMEGEIIDCTANTLLRCLLNKPGQARLQMIEKTNGCVIISDLRSSIIHMYGHESKITKTQKDINSYLDEIEGSEQGLVQMKGHDKPPGFMKLTMHRYGPLLDDFVKEFKLKSVSIDWKKHTVQLLGSKTDVEKASLCLAALEQAAWKEARSPKETSLPDCLVCMCPVEKKESLFRLEICGHPYCMDCFKYQVSYAVSNRDFPLSCAGDGCSSPFVWKEIKLALSQKWIQENKLISMAVNSFVMENKDKYKFCLTPNCPIVYEITDDENGHEFNCPLCFASICTSCHIAFHAGLTCPMAKSGAYAESDLKQWTARDPSKRKLCPGCNSPIEKIEGCQKMHCTICKTYFCWLCLEITGTEDKCYQHLRNVHGNIY